MGIGMRRGDYLLGKGVSQFLVSPPSWSVVLLFFVIPLCFSEEDYIIFPYNSDVRIYMY